jgi:hypothetical protein
MACPESDENNQVHGNNTEVGKEHQGTDVGIGSKVFYQIVTIGIEVIKEKYCYANRG